jgi:TonB family protein
MSPPGCGSRLSLIEETSKRGVEAASWARTATKRTPEAAAAAHKQNLLTRFVTGGILISHHTPGRAGFFRVSVAPTGASFGSEPTAKTARLEGTVRLVAIIDRDGCIQSLKVLEGHPILAGAARVAVQTWRYRPTILNGHAVEVATEILVRFHLDS